MPYSDKQRRAAFAELGRRKRGKRSRMFGSMSAVKLKKYAHSPLESEVRRGKKW